MPDVAARLAIDALAEALETAPALAHILHDVRTRESVYTRTLLGLLLEVESPIPYRLTIGEDGRIA